MPEFLLLYRSPKGYTNDEAKVDDWNDWLAGIGLDLLEAGRPVVDSAVLGAESPGLRLTGFSIISAADLGAARTVASGCPALDSGGAVEIGALVAMPEGHGPESA